MKRNGFDCLRLCACAALSFTVPAFADDWSWSGKTGNVTIPSGVTAYVGDADVATVSALTGIEILSGATLYFTNAAERCTLSAVLTGDGSCRSSGGALVTFAGESPSFTGEMHFANSYVRVASSRWGLGCGTNSSGQVRYVTSASGGLMFTADGICDPGIYWHGHRNSSATKYLMDDMSRKVVFNGPVKMNKMGNVDWLRTGDFTFNAGLGVNGSHGTPCFVVGGSSASVTTVVNNVAMNGGATYFPVDIAQNAALLLNVQGMRGGDIVFYGSGAVVCGTNDVLPQTCGLGRDDSQASGAKSGTIDLNGYNQSVKQLSSATYSKWKWTVTRGEEKFVTVTSAKDAAIRITGNVSPVPHACRFTGKASLIQAGGGTYTLVNQFSDTEGTLCVTNGTVKFDWGAGWGGDIEVFEQGRVVFSEKCEENFASPCEISLHEGGKIEVAANITLVCSKLLLDGEEVAEGTYTAESLGDWIEGDGSVLVNKAGGSYAVVRRWDGEGEGTGWTDAANWSDNTVPGAGEKVLIPAGVKVQVTDADVETIESVAAIEIAEGGMLEFVNLTKAVVLTNDISGAGDIRSSESAGITLSGYNFDHIGSAEFTNTAVYVMSRWALGNPSRPVVHWGTLSAGIPRPLRFRGAGLTNDVPIRIQGQRHIDGNKYYCFTDSFADPWVQNGYLDYILRSDCPTIYIGNYVFSDGIRNTQGSYQFFVREGMTCTITKTPLALSTSGNWTHFTISRTGTLRLETAGNKWTSRFSINGTGRLLCCVKNALATESPICLAKEGEKPILDLGGYDQTSSYVRNSDAPSWGLYNVSKGSKGHGIVTSEEPATLTLTSFSPVPAAIRFTGAVSLNCTGSRTNTYVNQYSDTAGTLSLTNGAVRFDWGAGWGGDISLSKKGRVIFAESCPSNRIGQGTGAVTLKDSARIVVSDGARYSCGSVMLGDTLITSGVLTAEKYPEWIEGDGVVYVGKRGMILSIR